LRKGSFIGVISAVVLILAACSSQKKVTVNENGDDLPFRKVVKSQDPELKFLYAEKYFTNKDYYKAQALFEELIPIWRLTEKGSLCYFRYAQCYYEMEDFYLASYYFKSFNKTHSTDPRAEEALFISALCKVKISPTYSLDQTDTKEAIDQMQLFLDKYPKSIRKDTCNMLIDKLTDKLDRKKFEVAMLYYKTSNYKAASIAFDVCLEYYPESNHKEEIMYYRIKSDFLLAENSIQAKKVERYEETIKSYHNFVSAFPESIYLKSAERILEDSKKQLEMLKQETT